MKIFEKVRQYLIEESMCDPDKLSDDTLIFDQGLLDSMGLLYLVQFLNDEFKVVVNDQELIKENFESVNAIASFVAGKLEEKKSLPAEQMPL
ncbi:acyl carrier protein [Flavihumibacter sp. R14]|nr:acyl carrier protein [Flavihumibacter soli]